MSQDYILLDPSQYYENNIATDITKYSRKEYNTTSTPHVNIENTVKLADISNYYAEQVSELQNNLEYETDFSEKLKRTIIILTVAVILILIILFCMIVCLKNKAIL